MSGSIETLATRGRTRVTARAMTRVVSAVAAESLGVKPSQVSVDLADVGGRLDLTVRTPLRVLPPDQVGTAPADGAVLDRTERAQHDIRGTVATLTGADIAGVTVRLTGAKIRWPKRAD
nr:hypothetical protein BJQ95_00281 [Cryobacterium sp. SO1]